jgi:hypothetical protein
VAESTGASAVLVEGKLVARGVLFRDCRARMNILIPARLDFWPFGWMAGPASRGGAVYALPGGEVAVLGSEFKRNVAIEGMFSRGGAVYALGANISIVGSRLVGNRAVGRYDGDMVGSGLAAGSGGAVFAVKSTVLVVSSSLLANSACRGGAIAVSDSNVRIVRSKLHGNRAVGRSAEGFSGGGAIYGESLTLEADGLMLEANVAEEGDRDSSGGGIRVRDSTVLLRGSELIANSATSGGALQVENSNVSLSDLNVRSNVAAFGGGVYSSASRWRLERCTISNNTVRSLKGLAGDVFGAAVLLGEQSWMNISDSELVANSAIVSAHKASGGCIYLQDSTLMVVQTVMRGNRAWSSSGSAMGGCLSVVGPAKVELAHVLISRSEVRTDQRDDDSLVGKCRETTGGAIYSVGPVDLTIIASRVEENRAIAASSPAHGGAIYYSYKYALGGLTVVMSRSNVTGNEAKGSSAQGGAIWSNAHGLHLEHIVLRDNSVTAIQDLTVNQDIGGEALGGSVYLAASASAMILDCVMEDSVAFVFDGERASAGALFVASGAIADLRRCIFRRNAIKGMSYWLRSSAGYDTYVNSIERAHSIFVSSAAHIHIEGEVMLDQCEIIDQMGLPAENTPDWWWMVAGSSAVVIFRRSAFSFPAGYTFDSCPFANNGYCDNNDAPTCPGEDYKDCDTVRPNGPGLLLSASSPSTQILIINCSITNLTIQATAILGIVNPHSLPR